MGWLCKNFNLKAHESDVAAAVKSTKDEKFSRIKMHLLFQAFNLNITLKLIYNSSLNQTNICILTTLNINHSSIIFVKKNVLALTFKLFDGGKIQALEHKD